LLESLIPKHGGYRKLKSFQVAELVVRMMTADSLRLAACSLGRTQRRRRAGTASRREIGDPRRADLIARRPENADAVAMWVKEQYQKQNDGHDGPDGRSMQSTRSIAEPVEAVAANAALTLIAVASSLLDRQLAAQAAAFEKEGGFTERLHRVRTARRGT
jgi:four helix bundle suffix protein